MSEMSTKAVRLSSWVESWTILWKHKTTKYKTIFLYCYPDCPSCPTSLKRMGNLGHLGSNKGIQPQLRINNVQSNNRSNSKISISYRQWFAEAIHHIFIKSSIVSGSTLNLFLHEESNSFVQKRDIHVAAFMQSTCQRENFHHKGCHPKKK